MNTQLPTPKPSLTVIDNHPVTTSLDVAAYFGKQHKNVIQKIKRLGVPVDFASANFSAHATNIQAGAVKRDSKIYNMTKDGFMFLVMGFTGEKAAAMKIAYINAFNEMAAKLRNHSPQFHTGRMLVSWENNQMVSITPVNKNEMVISKDSVASFIGEPGYFSLRQLIDVAERANRMIAEHALVSR